MNSRYEEGMYPTALDDLNALLSVRKATFEQKALTFIRTTPLCKTELFAKEDSGGIFQSDTLINYELLRFKQMAKKMRDGIFQDEFEKEYVESGRKGADYKRFWLRKRSVFQSLAPIVLKLLTIPASSSAVENVFLHTRNSQTTSRAALTNNHVDDLLTLFLNQKIH